MNPVPVDPAPRFVYREIQLTPEEAHKAWCYSVYLAAARVKVLEAELAEAKSDLADAQFATEPATRAEQVILYPGDPGYDEAPVGLDPTRYLGKFTWQNFPNPETLSPTPNPEP